jgi:hypothetical protein
MSSSLSYPNCIRLPDEVVRLSNDSLTSIWTRKGWLYVMDSTGQVWRCHKLKAKAKLEEHEEEPSSSG